MKKFVLHKLDRRHAGYHQFSHYISPIWQSRLDDKLEFLKWRKWCWTTWGPGMERNMAMELGSKQFDVCLWAWHTQDGSKRIYFASEKQASQFCLFWC